MSPFAIPPLIAATLNGIISWWVFACAPPGTRRRMFILWNLWLGLWNVGVMGGYLCPNAEAATVWYRFVSGLSISWIAPFFLHFVCAWTDRTDRRTQLIIRLSYIWAGMLTVIGLTTPLLMDGVKQYFWGYYPVAGRGEALFGVAYFLQTSYALSVLTQHARETSGKEARQAYALLAGAAICFGSGVTNFLPLYGIEVYPLGNLMNALYSVGIAYAIMEYGFLNMRVVIRQSAIYGTLCGGMGMVYLSLVSVFRHVFGVYGLEEGTLYYAASMPLTIALAPLMKSQIVPMIDRFSFFQIPAPSGSLAKGQAIWMGTLAEELAHELAKPLTQIMNERARLEKGLFDSYKESLARIEKEARRASAIVDSFAELSPQRKLECRQVEVSDLLEEALRVVGIEDSGIKLIRRYGTLLPVQLHPVQMVQVFTNILQNAIQAMPEGGELILEIKANEADNTYCVEMTDTGMGIPEPLLHRVMDPFVTTKAAQGGRGVGLTISRAMVERHGGRLEIESPVLRGRGTRVGVTLPFYPIVDPRANG